MARRSIADRLERNSIPEPNSGCLLWTGTISTTSGHGRMKVAGKWFSPHRLAYEAKNGPIPDGLDICHSCDVPSCINEAHLWPGTHQDNMADMWRKGRWRARRVNAVWPMGQPHNTALTCAEAERIALCGRCDGPIKNRGPASLYCSNKCRWKVTRTEERRAQYNAARSASRRRRPISNGSVST